MVDILPFFGGRQKSRESYGACDVKLTLDNLNQHRVDRRQSIWEPTGNETGLKENGGLEACTQEKFLMPRPLERRKRHSAIKNIHCFPL